VSAAPDNQARATARVGLVLKDKWTLDALLGIGGMAAVYSATHRNHKRVAIKMLLPDLAGIADVRDRFVREGYAANQINHPGVLSVLDDDVAEDGLPFLVMELLEGETVEARWRRGGEKLEVAEVLAIAGSVLDVLVAANTKGVVHRDIKPENLFLLQGGGLKVLDFGIARVLEGASGRTTTRAGEVMGTPAFMAPEQALARWHEVDGRTDLWAVGATMYTLLTGEHVHEAANGNEQLVKSATQPAPSVSWRVMGLPRSVVALVDRALKFERAARWPDAAAMLEAVKGAYESVTGTPLVIEAPGAGVGSLRGASAPTASGVRSANRPPPPPPPRRKTSGEHSLQVTLPAAVPAVPPRRPSSGAIGEPRPTPSSAGMQAPVVPPRRTSSGSFPGPRTASSPTMTAVRGSAPQTSDPTIIDMGSGRAPALAPPPMAAFGMDAFIAGRTAERDAANAEVARYQPVVAEIQGRLAAARRRVAQAQEQITATRRSRAAEEERFQGQRNARLEGVGEARKDFRRKMCHVAELALEDVAHFPPSIGAPEREAIRKTGTFAAARRRDDALHRAALTSFDPVALKRGVALASAAIVVFLVLFFSPIIIRSCSPDTGTMTPGSGQSP
jgi:serine/threonine-protein kinase